ncbi:SDR family oxidoreductase [Natrarchaeobius oligotrophus]|uniref:NAD-dependent epimerase/dehydratase family protein n=1 Tax=Natrarchaeobius chitinivorans TaxID=1679083 RepID=A0A3N6MGT2_NATCH|nr:NAD(P)H-binding protein [Natrarchaeobius chitinivorans]RQH03294.1 NAD-dependent epimerase/dehydratase family protein [Natrarchaeobius chitinivorans]
MSDPVRTLLTGATGTLGRALRPRLVEAGHDVRAASRSPRSAADGVEWVELDLADGTGLPEALEGVDVVVHAASAPRGDSEAVDVRGTERLLEAAAAEGVSNVCYVSIVGVDRIPLSYYEHKREAERLVEERPVPSTIVRATQFHSFAFELLETVSRLPIWPLPTAVRIQPVDVGEVAAAICERATLEPAGRVPPVGGPEVRTVRELASAYREAKGLGRPIVRLPVPGSAAAAFRNGEATCPDRAVGTVSWEAWLSRRLDS